MSLTILENAMNMHYLKDLVGWNVVVETSNKKVYAGVIERFDDIFPDMTPIYTFLAIRGTDGIANIVWIHKPPYIVDIIFVD